MDTLFDLLSGPVAALAADVAVKSTLVLAVAGVSALVLRRAPPRRDISPGASDWSVRWSCRSWPSRFRAGIGLFCRPIRVMGPLQPAHQLRHPRRCAPDRRAR